MRTALALSFLVALGASPVFAQDPVKVAPSHYKPVFENEYVRILRITYGPHEKSVMHEHPASVAVFLTDNQHFRFTSPDGTSEEGTSKLGEATWRDGGIHLPENLTDQTAELILVELKAIPVEHD